MGIPKNTSMLLILDDSLHKKRRRLAKELQKCLQNEAQFTFTEEDVQLIKMMCLIFAIFLFCFLPSVIVQIIDGRNANLTENENIMDYPDLHIISSLLYWIIPVINPFIYAFKNRIYQPAFIKLYKNLIGQPYIKPYRGSSGLQCTTISTNSSTSTKSKTSGF